MSEPADFDDVARALAAAGSAVHAAEAHGCLCGAACVRRDYGLAEWLDGDPPRRRRRDDDRAGDAAGEHRGRARRRARWNSSRCCRDDEQALEAARRGTRAHGASGFLYGFGAAGTAGGARLPDDVAEVLGDLAQFSQAGAVGSESPEVEEDAYIELVEFVRAAVQLVYDELAALRASPATPQHRPLTRTMTVRKDEFARRRRQLMRMIGKGGIAILPAATEKQRNSDVHYHYRPDSDFHYLTGFDEPESVAVLVPGRAQAEYILFVRDRDPLRETWDGKRAGTEGATRDHGADDAFPIGDIDDILPGLIEQCGRVYHTMGIHPEFDQHVIGWVNTLRGQAKQGMHTPQEFVALDHLLHDMRLYKSRTELAVMRRAAQISVGAHVRAMKATRPGTARVRGDGGAPARVPPPRRRHRLPPDRAAAARTPARCTTTRTTRNCATATCC